METLKDLVENYIELELAHQVWGQKRVFMLDVSDGHSQGLVVYLEVVEQAHNFVEDG